MGQKVSPIGLWLGISLKHQSQWFVDPRNGYMQKNYPSLILEDWFIRDFITLKFAKASIAHILIFRILNSIWIEIYIAPIENLSLILNSPRLDKALTEKTIPAPKSRILVPSNKNIVALREQENEKQEQPYVGLSSREESQNNLKFKTLNNTNHDSLRLPVTTPLNLKTFQEDLQLALAKYKRQTSLIFSNPRNTNNNQNLLNLSAQSINLGILIKQLNKPFEYASIFAKYLVSQLEIRENTIKQVFNRSLWLIQNYKIKGIKIKISGRLNGADIAEHKSVFKGWIPLSTLDAKIDYSYKTAKTLYGILGIKVWIWREEN